MGRDGGRPAQPGSDALQRAGAEGGRYLGCWGATEQLWNAFHNLLLWKAQRYGKLMRPKPLYEPTSASIAFHNHAPRNEAINLSETVNRPRRRAGGVIPSIASIFSVGSARR